MVTILLRSAWILAALSFVWSSQTAFAGTLTNVAVMPTSNVVLQTTEHVMSFKVATTATVKTIQITYPAGFTLTNKLIEVVRSTSTGTQSFLNGTLAVSAPSLILTLAGSTGTSLTAGDTINVEVGSIGNASSLSNAMTITTKNSSGGTIDTGSTTLTLVQVNTGMIASGAVTGTQLSASSVDQTKIADGAVTGTKVAAGTLTGSNIAAGTISGSNIGTGTITGLNIGSGTISGANIGFGTITSSNIQPAAHRVVVATSGGDYTTIGAALAAISPTASDPYVIDVMPGTYTENIVMKGYVHLRGAGREVTTLQALNTNDDVISVGNSNLAVSGFTIKGGTAGIHPIGVSNITIGSNKITGNSYAGILNDGMGSLSETIIENIIMGNGQMGIYNNASSPTINGNIVSGNGLHGIYNLSASSPMISGNTITGQGYYGILNIASSPTITSNTITGNVSHGISSTNSSSPTIVHNKITDNGAAGEADIFVNGDSVPNISFNVYDDINGTTGVGLYNVNSSGDPAPAP